jgi:hypothetical protein
MNEEELVKKAEKRAKEKLGFMQHLFGYLFVNVFLFAVNMITDRNDLWFLWVVFGWGIGLFFHAVSVFAGYNFLSNYYETQKKKELERLRKTQN